MPVKVLVIGAGGIGGFVGGRLALFGQDVTLVNRNPKFVSEIQKRGLLLEEKKNVTAVPQIKIYSSAEEALSETSDYDIVIFTVKGYDTRETISKIGPLIANKKYKFLTLQNGVGNEEIIEEYIPRQQLLSGILTLPVTVVEPGWVRLEPNRGGVGIASVNGDNEYRWVDFFKQCGFLAEWYQNYKSLKWSKLLLNIIGNAIPAILQTSPREVYKYKEIFLLERGMLKESVQVVKMLGVPIVKLPGYPIPLFMKLLTELPPFAVHPFFCSKVAKGRGEKPPSLLLDLKANRGKTEIEILNGAVVRAAKNIGFSVPVNEALTNILLDLAAGCENIFFNNPKKLLEFVQKNELFYCFKSHISREKKEGG